MKAVVLGSRVTRAGSGIAGICKVTILPAARAFCCASAAPLKNARTRPERVAELFQQRHRAVIVLDIGWVHLQDQQRTDRVGGRLGVFGSRNRTTLKQRTMELNCSEAQPERIACGPSPKLRPPAAASG